jgi:hypothetical protein
VGGGRRRSAIKRSISEPSHPRDAGKKEMATYVERSETSAVGVKCLIVEIDELLSDRVDVCHGFFSWWE